MNIYERLTLGTYFNSIISIIWIAASLKLIIISFNAFLVLLIINNVYNYYNLNDATKYTLLNKDNIGWSLTMSNILSIILIGFLIAGNLIYWELFVLSNLIMLFYILIFRGDLFED